MRKGKMTILASVFIAASIIFSLGLGTMAWFSDTAIAGPVVTAGTVDLLMCKEKWGTYSDTLEFPFPVGFAPGDSFQIDVYLKGDGTSGSRALWVYGKLNSDPNMLRNQIYIVKVGFQDNSGMVYPGDNPDGGFYATGTIDMKNIFGDATYPLTLNEFCTSKTPTETHGYMRFFWGTSTDMIDYLPDTGVSRLVELTFYFNEDAGNEYQGKVCDFDIVFEATDDIGYGIIWENPWTP